MNKLLAWVVVLGISLGVAWVLLSPRKGDQTGVRAAVEALPAAIGTFDRVTGPVRLEFPLDHGPHPNFQTEWWYYTGNLVGETGEKYGFQLTFFRRALVGADKREARSSNWAVQQVYLAHFAVTDVTNARFYPFERLERGAAGLAGSNGNTGLKVWLHDWRVEQSGENRYTLFAAEDGVRLELILEDTKGPILQGNQGYSRKGPEEGNASIYFSQTRLEASGTIEIDGRRSLVRGSSWMDHEFSTSALSTGQIGWDWFSIQLEDGSELMVYTIRRADGSVDDFSQGTVIQPDGKTRRLTRDDFNLKVDETWVSPHSGGKYPSGWSLEIPSEGLILSIRPLLADQELNLSFIYWEGAVEITGQRSGVGISGHGYVELTGYAQSLEGRF